MSAWKARRLFVVFYWFYFKVRSLASVSLQVPKINAKLLKPKDRQSLAASHKLQKRSSFFAIHFLNGAPEILDDLVITVIGFLVLCPLFPVVQVYLLVVNAVEEKFKLFRMQQLLKKPWLDKLAKLSDHKLDRLFLFHMSIVKSQPKVTKVLRFFQKQIEVLIIHY